uniref:hypothetical protein n=1 Tax=Mixta calida TaxID=665913 RepID=UPI0034D5AE18
ANVQAFLYAYSTHEGGNENPRRVRQPAQPVGQPQAARTIALLSSNNITILIIYNVILFFSHTNPLIRINFIHLCFLIFRKKLFKKQCLQQDLNE